MKHKRKNGSLELDSTDIQSKYHKKKLRKKRTRKLITITVLVLILVICILLSPIFNIRNFYVDGINYVTTEQAINSGGLVSGRNTFTYNLMSISKKIAKLPFVDEVTVKRILPSAVSISIKESVPAADVVFVDSNIIIDKKGKVLEVNSASEDCAYPHVTGLDVTDFTPGKMLKTSDDEKLNRILSTVNELSDNEILDRVESADITDVDNLTLKIGSVDVIVGDISQIDYKIKYLKAIMDTLNNGERGRIDLTTIPNVVFKEYVTGDNNP